MTSLRWLFKAFIIVITFCAIGAGFLYHEITQPITLTQPQVFEVQKGDTSFGLGEKLAQRGWITYPFLTRVVAKLHPEWIPKVGQYEITNGMTLLSMMALFDSGKSIVYTITLVEGNTLQEYLKAMKAKGNIQMTLEGLSNAQIAKKLGIKRSNPEGLFFANTYQYHNNTTDLRILKRAHNLLESHLKAEWETRDQGLPYKTPYQALIMASMIEKETGVPEERGLIAGVFINRLHKHMRLQTDPTVIYGLGKDYNGTITYKDLRSKSLYNTYLHKGFPPTPITNVGLRAIVAALHPTKTDDLYFVAKGDGSHVFSKTLAQHNKAVDEYQMQRRADYRSSPEPQSVSSSKKEGETAQ
ncbi:putative aminodeoxychorismate lyase [Marinomonas spartinae]|uniref:Endolytic murein transglycosylase n=1 Tax=Marinomonas spartinae TaxID=1792290 RepID=A0A1A8TL92_9GAMM|nr:endolytic transglycosylase MltG [Marinomonas spartinae]SBS33811.1 putative aminodeoxychorismate lyase [Marinomonas spartinae]SBS38095.1 putative aminodeoxychorismate lyase [Marinomonas spartinae]